MNKAGTFLVLAVGLISGCLPASVNDQYACFTAAPTPAPVEGAAWSVTNMNFLGSTTCDTVSQTDTLLIQKKETLTLTTSAAGGGFYVGTWVIRLYASNPGTPDNCSTIQNTTTITFGYQISGTKTVTTLGHQQAVINILMSTAGGSVNVADATATNSIGICGKTNFTTGTTTFPAQIGTDPDSCMNFFRWNQPMNLSAAARPYLHFMTANYLDGGVGGILDYTRTAPETSFRNTSVPYYSGDKTGLKIYAP